MACKRCKKAKALLGNPLAAGDREKARKHLKAHRGY